MKRRLRDRYEEFMTRYANEHFIDGVTASKYTCDGNLYFVFIQKHYCENCSSLLKGKMFSKVIKRDDPDAKNYDFTDMDGHKIYGNMRVGEYKFYCENCGKNYKTKDVKRYERKIRCKKKYIQYAKLYYDNLQREPNIAKRFERKLNRMYKRVVKDNIPRNMLTEIMSDESPMAQITAAKHALRLRYTVDKAICTLMELSRIKYVDAALKRVGYEASRLVEGIGYMEIS